MRHNQQVDFSGNALKIMHKANLHVPSWTIRPQPTPPPWAEQNFALRPQQHGRHDPTCQTGELSAHLP